jgi:uncharacterized protein YbjQ (UPF0145 family)
MREWRVFTGGTTRALRVDDSGLHVDDTAIQWPHLRHIEYPSTFNVSLTIDEDFARDLALDPTYTVGFESAAEQRSFRAEVEARLTGVDMAERPSTQQDLPTHSSIDASRITTLHVLPGHRIVRSLGLVSQLSATSGFTATMKGKDALTTATTQLITTAQRLGANAIVGVSASSFGAGGGITSAFGGDAVGVLLLGTAVVVEPEEQSPSAHISSVQGVRQ